MAKEFLYKQVEDQIVEKIRAGILKPGEKIGTTKELAEQFETSIITINKAFSNLVEQGYISRAPKLGSVVNSESKWLKSGNSSQSSKMIGAIVFDSSSPYLWAKALKGMEDSLREQGYNLVIGNDNGDSDKALQYIDDLADKGIEGFIVVPIGKISYSDYEKENAKLFNSIDKRSIPYVSFHRYIDAAPSSFIGIDNYADAKSLTMRFLDAGIKNPYCITHYYDSVVAERERGFIDALRLTGIDSPEDRIIRTSPLTQTIADSHNEDIARLITEKKTLDGILTLSANLLNATLSTVDKHREILQEDVKFATFDYAEAFRYNSDILMSMIPPAFEMGKAAADILLDKIQKNGTVSVKTLMPSSFISNIKA